MPLTSISPLYLTHYYCYYSYSSSYYSSSYCYCYYCQHSYSGESSPSAPYHSTATHSSPSASSRGSSGAHGPCPWGPYSHRYRAVPLSHASPPLSDDSPRSGSRDALTTSGGVTLTGICHSFVWLSQSFDHLCRGIRDGGFLDYVRLVANSGL